jgi:hypothetical protein
MKPNCASCHVGLDFKKQRPAMQTCEGCHDGKSAFDALGTQCDRCHQAPPGAQLQALPPSKPFQHEFHAKLDVKIDDCTSCHGVGIEWEKVRAGRDQHRPCQGCHAAEFRKAEQPICLGCHVRNDPFRPNPLRPPAEAMPEWRSPDSYDLQHAPHIAAGMACETCHPAPAGLPARAPALGHAECGKCHLPKRATENREGTPITLDQCAACHVLSSVPRGGGKRPWSTRDHFRHDENHRVRPCAECHLAEGAQDLTPPTMEGCATCHDGKKAFETVGRECSRCHDR